MLLDRADGHQKEDCCRSRFLPLDMRLQQGLLERGTRLRAAQHQHDLQRILQVAGFRPVVVRTGNVGKVRKALALRQPALRGNARAEVRRPLQALVDELHPLQPHLHAGDVESRQERIVRRGRMPVAQELVQVVRELLERAVPIEREAAPEPAELRRRVLLQQRLEPQGDVDHRGLGERGHRLVG